MKTKLYITFVIGLVLLVLGYVLDNGANAVNDFLKGAGTGMMIAFVFNISPYWRNPDKND